MNSVIIITLFFFAFFNHPLLFAQSNSKVITVASKKFTENVILGEILSQLLSHAGYEVQYRKELGGTRVLWNALLRGDIQIYPEYTGTIINEILPKIEVEDFQSLRIVLRTFSLRSSAPLGFNNTYALGMRREVAESLSIHKISDLSRFPYLKFGFTNEFMDRSDGWRGLRSFYHLPQKEVNGLDHDLAYRGLAANDIQVIDFYSTDAEIRYYNLVSLQDDRHFFPRYEAIYIFREDLLEIIPDLEDILQQLSGTIDARAMIEMNSGAKINKKPEVEVAGAFLKKILAIQSTYEKRDFVRQFLLRSREHLYLVLISLLAAIFLAVPLGIISAKFSKTGKFILAITGIIQTIPSLALLVFMIPLLGIGGTPAIMALFLYSLLPIVRNTYAGLKDIPSGIVESAIALGFPSFFILRKIELPLALRSILAGVKTSAVINIGTATLGALIGAGGYGQPILTGIRLDDIGLILQGAVPAALLALAAQGVFDLLEKYLIPGGLK